MSSCDNSNIKKNYIVTGTEQDILSACTGFYTNDIYPCSGDTIIVHSDILNTNTINSTVILSGGTNLLDIFGSLDTNTFVTGFTYDNSNNLNIIRNDGVSFGVNITEFSGITINGVLSACTGVYTTNLYGCSPITVQDDLILLSGLTLSTITNDDSLSEILVRDSVTGLVKYRDVSSIIPDTNTFVTGTTFGSNQFVLTRNDGFDVLKLSGGSNVTLSNPSTNQIKIDVSIPPDTNTFVTGGTYNPSTDTITLTRNDSVQIDITGVTDTFTTGGTYDNGTKLITFVKNDGTNYSVNLSTIDTNDTFTTGFTYDNVNTFTINRNDGVDLSTTITTLSGVTYYGNGIGLTNIPLSGVTNLETELDSKTNLTLFNSHTGDTNNPHDTSFSNLTSTAHTHTISDVINLQTELDNKTDNADFISHTGDTTIHFTKSSINLSDLGSSAHTHTLSEITDFNTYSGNVQTQIDSKLDITTFNTYTGNTQSLLDTKISGATNLSSEGIFAQKNGLDLEFKGLTSTGGTVNITSDSNTVNLEVIFPIDQDKFVSGGTYNDTTKNINFTGNSVETTFNVDLTSLYNSLSGDTFVISGNADVATSQLTFTNNTGGTFTVTNSAALFSDNDINVTGGTYNPSTGCVTFTTNSGTTFDVCGFVTGITDTYTTGSTLVGETIQFDSNVLGPNYYNVSLSPVLSGKTDLSLFNTHTGDTNNPHQTSFENLISTAHTHTISDITNLQTEIDSKLNITDFNTYSGNVQTQLNTKVENGINSGGANEVFSGKSGNDLYFRTISGGSNTTITTINDIIKVDVSVPVDTNTFVTGGTYNSGSLTLNRNDGGNVIVTGFLDGDYLPLTGGTVNGDVNISGQTILTNSGQNTLTIIGSGDTEPILLITGSTGELFSVTDTSDGTIYQINDSTANTIFEVNSDTRIVMGSYNAPSLYATTGVTVDSGSTMVYSFDSTNYDGVFVDYTLMGTLGARSGNMMGVFSGNTIQYTETSTNDIGNTSSILLSMSTSGNTTSINTTSTTNGWTVKTIIRSI